MVLNKHLYNSYNNYTVILPYLVRDSCSTQTGKKKHGLINIQTNARINTTFFIKT